MVRYINQNQEKDYKLKKLRKQLIKFIEIKSIIIEKNLYCKIIIINLTIFRNFGHHEDFYALYDYLADMMEKSLI